MNQWTWPYWLTDMIAGFLVVVVIVSFFVAVAGTFGGFDQHGTDVGRTIGYAIVEEAQPLSTTQQRHNPCGA